MWIRVPVYKYVNTGKEPYSFSKYTTSIFIIKPHNWQFKTKCNELEWAFYYAWLYFFEFQNYLACIFNFGTICRLFSFLFKRAKHWECASALHSNCMQLICTAEQKPNFQIKNHALRNNYCFTRKKRFSIFFPLAQFMRTACQFAGCLPRTPTITL